MDPILSNLYNSLARISPVSHGGYISRIDAVTFRVTVDGGHAHVGDLLFPEGEDIPAGEVISVTAGCIEAMPYQSLETRALGEKLELRSRPGIAPGDHWTGRVVDAFGRPLDHRTLTPGPQTVPLDRRPPEALTRAPLGARLKTGLTVFDTLLPITEGQRIGLFAGSGVGKTTLLTQLGTGIETDVVVLALVGERGRELRAQLDMMPDTMRDRCITVVATADRPALERRRALKAAVTIAEAYRDQGRSVLLLVDNLTRFAEAHRDVATAGGERSGPGGWPGSIAAEISAITERTGSGGPAQGSITAVFAVLVPASDQDDPIADMVRGYLDGHIVLDRAIAERGRFPAIDIGRSVSRALPMAASDAENATISRVRSALHEFEAKTALSDAGLYEEGTSAAIDGILTRGRELLSLLSTSELSNPFEALDAIVDRG